MAVGHIHSIESMGLVDGPGIRTVIFMQGCALRCRYCHNPDTWDFGKGIEMTCEELLAKLLRYKSYYDSTGGGVTFSGGEPLMQPEFLSEMLKKCKQSGINTCIDTAGFGKGNYGEILKNTDLLLYDVKHYDAQQYKNITSREIDKTHEFIEEVRKYKVPMIVRHVVVPNLTDGEEHIRKLGEYINTLPKVQGVELLAYHLLGVNKYKELGYGFSLDGVPPMDIDRTAEYQALLNKITGGIKNG